MATCGKYLGDNDGTCPQLACIRDRGHDGLCDNVRGDCAKCEGRGWFWVFRGRDAQCDACDGTGVPKR